MPWQIVPVVVTQVQDVVAAGQIRPTDQLIGVEQMAKPGTITVLLEPLFEGALEGLRIQAALLPFQTLIFSAH